MVQTCTFYNVVYTKDDRTMEQKFISYEDAITFSETVTNPIIYKIQFLGGITQL